MSRTRLAREIAAETGTNIRSALRYVDDVGRSQARRSLRAAEDRTTWRLPATVGIGTGGVLAWRQQNINEAEAIADQHESARDSLKAIVESDMDGDDKAELAEIFATQQANGDDEEETGPNLLDRFLGNGGMEGTLVTIVVLVLVLGFVLNYASQQLPSPSVQAGVGSPGGAG